MVNGISGTTGSVIAQVAAQQSQGANAPRVDHDGDQDDGGPVNTGPDIESTASAAAADNAKGSLFHGIA